MAHRMQIHVQGKSHRSRVVKRLLDLLIGSVLLIVALPLMGLIAIIIHLRMGRPVLFRQQRVGLYDSRFTMLKFRTMQPEADSMRDSLRTLTGVTAQSSPVFKMENDPRVTSLGRLLRRWSLDELPQLVNVLGGSMSLVGPRPHTVDDVAGYSQEAFERLTVPPGLTGSWQVAGRCNLDWDTSLQLDLDYARHGSLGTDLRILRRTITAVISGDGAI